MSTELSDDDIHFIANESMRNAAGGIYASRVIRFAREVIDHDRALRVSANPAGLMNEIERLRGVLDKIAKRTSSDDPCRPFVQMARDALRVDHQTGLTVEGARTGGKT